MRLIWDQNKIKVAEFSEICVIKIGDKKRRSVFNCIYSFKKGLLFILKHYAMLITKMINIIHKLLNKPDNKVHIYMYVIIINMFIKYNIISILLQKSAYPYAYC